MCIHSSDKIDGLEEHGIICKLNQTVTPIAKAVPDVVLGGKVYQHNPPNFIGKNHVFFSTVAENKRSS